MRAWPRFILDVTCSNLTTDIAAAHTPGGPVERMMAKFEEIVREELDHVEAWAAAPVTDRLAIEAKVGISVGVAGAIGGYLRTRATISVPGDSVYEFFTPGTDALAFLEAVNERLIEIPNAGGGIEWLTGISGEGGPTLIVDAATIIAT